MPKIHLHLNGAVLFSLGLYVYIKLGYPVWAFLTFLLLPDIFMLGYLINPKTGARVYNVGHSLMLPAIIGLIAYMSSIAALGAVGLIWAAHIGMDHAFGYGYKYDDAFKHTHLQDL